MAGAGAIKRIAIAGADRAVHARSACARTKVLHQRKLIISHGAAIFLHCSQERLISSGAPGLLFRRSATIDLTESLSLSLRPLKIVAAYYIFESHLHRLIHSTLTHTLEDGEGLQSHNSKSYVLLVPTTQSRHRGEDREAESSPEMIILPAIFTASDFAILLRRK